MNLTILGSAAAEGWPAMFCRCELCAEARRRGGKDIRRRTSYRLGDHIHIDWGPDTFAACLALGLDTSGVTDLVVTHSHEDHFTPHELVFRRPGFSVVPEEQVLTVHGSEAVEAALRTHIDDDALFRTAFNLLRPYEEQVIGATGVRVVPLPASHAPESGPFNYIFGIGDRRLLIANDTGWWEEEVWEFLAGFTLDVVVMDCTYGERHERRGHLGAPDVVEAKGELCARGALAQESRFIANHFSHNGGRLHAQFEEFFAPHGIETGHDGMVVAVGNG